MQWTAGWPQGPPQVVTDAHVATDKETVEVNNKLDISSKPEVNGDIHIIANIRCTNSLKLLRQGVSWCDDSDSKVLTKLF